MAERIFEIEREPGEEIVFRIRTAKFPVFPEPVRSHLWAAQKEGLLALRSLIDVAIEQTERDEKPGKKEPRKVKVE
jgi:hypothetical protein